MIRPLGDMPEFPRRHKRRRLRSVPMLPTLLTLGNLYFGFAAMYCCARELEDLGRQTSAITRSTLNSDYLEARAPSFLSIACWFILASMICDALDGRVARKTGQASQFGVQLDSIADIVSFGAAPALMMLTMTRREIMAPLIAANSPAFSMTSFGKLALFIAAIYVCCAGLRLARFNVEATLEEASHKGFKGLPSPAAAAAVISLVFLHDHLDMRQPVWPATAQVITHILPIATLAVALLMVSRVPYVHAVSSFLRRRPFWQIVPILIALVLFWAYTELITVLVAWGFVLTGPVKWALRWGRGAPATALHPNEPQSSVSPRKAE